MIAMVNQAHRPYLNSILISSEQMEPCKMSIHYSLWLKKQVFQNTAIRVQYYHEDG